MGGLGVVLGVCLSLSMSGVAGTFFVSSESMEPSLKAGSFAVGVSETSRWGYGRGDVVVFENPGGWPVGRDEWIVKRIVGVEGDVVSVGEGGRVLVNGVDCGRVSSQFFDSVSVSEGYVFVMGDNEGVSADSRRFGVVPRSCIRWRVVFPSR